MSKKLTPIRWKNFVRRLKQLGFHGPFIGGKHPYMIKGDLVLTIPNPHKRDIGIPLLVKILKQAGINKDDWLNI